MTKPNFTAEQLDGLTDEEREGLMDEAIVDDPEEIVATAAANKPEDKAPPAESAAQDEAEHDSDEEGDEEGDDGAQAATDDMAAAATEPDATPPAADADEITLDTRPAMWLGMGALEEQKSSLDQQLRALAAKFDDGEFTGTEYHEKREEIEKQLEPVRTELMRAGIKKADADDAWKNDTVPSFLAANPAYAEKGSVLNMMLDAEVRKIQSTAANPRDPKILDLAHQRISKQIGAAYGVAPKAASKQPTTPAKPAGKRELPPTLGGLPASDITDPVDGTVYAHLDRLAAKDPIAYDAALAKMSPAQLDDYLSR